MLKSLHLLEGAVRSGVRSVDYGGKIHSLSFNFLQACRGCAAQVAGQTDTFSSVVFLWQREREAPGRWTLRKLFDENNVLYLVFRFTYNSLFLSCRVFLSWERREKKIFCGASSFFLSRFLDL